MPPRGPGLLSEMLGGFLRALFALRQRRARRQVLLHLKLSAHVYRVPAPLHPGPAR